MSILAAIDSTWWWASLSLAIPIAIHLISRGKHQSLPFSTLAFFPKKAPLNHQQIKMTQRRLLALRLLLILAILFILANVFKAKQGNEAQVFYLVSDAWLKYARLEKREALAAKLREPSKSHVAIRLQNNKRILPEQVLNTTNILPQKYSNIWQNVAKWQQANPTATNEILVYSSGSLSEFMGEKFTLLANTKWDISENTNTLELPPPITLSLIVLQPADESERTKAQTKSVLSAITAFNQLPRVNIEVYQYPKDEISYISDKLAQQIPPTIIQIGEPQTQLIKQIRSQWPATRLVYASALAPIERDDFPIFLADVLFDQALNIAFWQSATLNPQTIADNGAGITIANNSAATPYSSDMVNEPLNIPAYLALFCVILFAGERIYSEHSAKQSRRLSAQQVSANNG